MLEALASIVRPALIVVVLGVLGVQAVELNRMSGRAVGIVVEEEPRGGILVEGVVKASPADRGGLQAGDRLLAIDGHPVQEVADYDPAARHLRRGRPASFRIERDGALLDLRLVPGTGFPWSTFLVNALTALGYLAIAFLTLLQRGGDLRARLLFLFSVAVALEFSSAFYFFGRPQLNLFLDASFYLLSGIQMALELHLASVIPEAQPWLRRNTWLTPAVYAVGLLLGGAGALSAYFEDVGIDWLPWSGAQADAFFQDLMLPLWAVGVTVLLAAAALRHPDQRGRLQATLVLAGVVPWTVFVLATTALELLGQVLPLWLDPVQALSLLCYPVAVFVAIFRYRLLDLELVARRSLVYTLLSTALLLVFYGLLGAGGALFSTQVEGRGSVWVIAGATLILGLLFSPLRRTLERITYRRFFPERVELRQRLSELAAELPALGTLPRMGAYLVERLCEIFHVRWATMLLAEPRSHVLLTLASTLEEIGPAADSSVLLPGDDPALAELTRSSTPTPAESLIRRSPVLLPLLRRLRASLMVPVVARDRLVALLALGPLATGERYPAEESELLSLLSHHVASVFENARLFTSATRDSLTGLLRREAILECLEEELRRALRHARPLAVAMADLDHFKRANDRYGHLAGDGLLRWVAFQVEEHLRRSDHVGRYGGEELLLVLPETGLGEGIAVAEEIRAAVEAGRFHADDGTPIEITVSFGVTALRPSSDGPPPTPHDLISAADRALYRAKDAGRNRVVGNGPPKPAPAEPP